MAEILVVEVRLWGEQVGAVAPLRGKPGLYEFEYAPAFVRAGLAPAPIKMPAALGARYSFPALALETFHGLPGLLADSLPDRFGNALIDEYLARHGMRMEDVTSLQRLLYVGKRAMGALEFEPAMPTSEGAEAAVPLEISVLVEDARRALSGEISKVTQSILDVGSSAGGARAKAVIGWNPKTRAVLSGQFDLPPGYEHWLLKFDGVEGAHRLGAARGFGRIEYAHYLMALDCGITMSECALLEEGGRAHFMSRRFDRRGNEKIHMQTLCGLQHLDFNIPYVSSYEQYFRTILELNLGAQALRQAWLRCAFNVMARNCDDHTKNLAFIMDAAGRWSLSPAYDMSFSHDPGPNKWTRQHQMLVNGKARDIARADLMTVARQFDVDGAARLLDRITEVLRQWPRYARDVGVPDSEISRIAGLQQLS
ncbi:MAG TPA: type II toxin-antitoxin system HipA family toxin [Steroidobacteraceae bacterium]|nr:type II toxin-antitoxin system HipA family toxin [Steroidobacteraceae bacterium]